MSKSKHAHVELTEEEILVLARLWNEPQRKLGPIGESLLAKKMIKHDRGWTSLTPAGKRARAFEFNRRHGFGELITKFWNRDLY